MNLSKRLQQLTIPQFVMIFLVLAGIFLRFWNFRNTLQFLGDQGRDALVVKRIIKDHDPVLIGPVTSTGNMYLGPLYYYFMAPFLALTYPDPIGPAVAIAVLSVITIVLIYLIGKEIFGEQIAVIAAFFFTFSKTVVTYSRFSWNPNPAPIVSVLLFWAVYRAIKKSPWYWVMVSVCIAILMQLHYVSLLAFGAAGFVWLLVLISLIRKAKPKDSPFAVSYSLQKLFLATGAAVVLFVAFLSPQILFDMRHNYLNANSLRNFISDSQNPVKSDTLAAKIAKTTKETHGRSMQILFEMFIGQNRWLNTILWIVVLVAFGMILTKKKKDSSHLGYLLLFIFYVISIIGLSFYRGSVFDHYLGFHWPLTFFIYGMILIHIMKKPVGAGLAGLFVVGFLFWNIPRMPLRTLGWTMDKMKATSQTILDRVEPGEKYDIVLLSETGDIQGQSYRYFLDTTDRPTVSDAEKGDVKELFIINEDRKLKKVTDSPIFWIVVFPNKTPAEVYTIPNGPEITVLRK
jgi:4-amino-4-deoxy-L-arabinose transferase-like glycosyltransferase